MGRFCLFFRVAPPGCGGQRIKRLVILFVPGYTAGLPRFVAVSPGHEKPGETEAKRGNPAVLPGANKMTSRFIQRGYLHRTVNAAEPGWATLKTKQI